MVDEKIKSKLNQLLTQIRFNQIVTDSILNKYVIFNIYDPRSKYVETNKKQQEQLKGRDLLKQRNVKDLTFQSSLLLL